jgi:hypothetical protein
VETVWHTVEWPVGDWGNKRRNPKVKDYTTYNLWDTAKAMLRKKFIAISASIFKKWDFLNKHPNATA